MEEGKGDKTKIIAIVEDSLAEALDYILKIKGYNSIAEFVRDKVRREAEELGFFKYIAEKVFKDDFEGVAAQ